MSKILSEAEVFTANIVVPEDGIDLRTAASVEAPIQALANRSKYLLAYVQALHAAVYSPPREISVPALPTLLGSHPDVANWDCRLDSNVPVSVQLDNLSASNLIVPISLPSAWSITAAGVVVKGSWEGSHSSLPQFPLQFQLVRINSDGTSTTIASRVDPSASVGTYDAWHVVSTTTIAGADVAYNSAAAYYFRIIGESGSNSIGDCAARTCFVRLTRTSGLS